MPTDDVRVRAATDADLAAVADIYAHYVTTTVITFDEQPPPVSAWRQRLADFAARGLPFLVAEVNGQIAGYAYASPWKPKTAYRHTVEDTIYLAPEWTGKGLGRLLCGALLDACRRAGVRQVIAVIADTGSHQATLALHRAFGFTEAGRLRGVGHKHGRWIDTVLLQRDLTAPTQAG